MRHCAWSGALEVFGDENAVSGGTHRRQEGRRDGVQVEGGELLHGFGPEAAEERFLTTAQVPEEPNMTTRTRLAVWACRHRLPRERGFLPGLFDFNLMSELKQSLLFCLAGSLIYVGMPTQPACLSHMFLGVRDEHHFLPINKNKHRIR